MNDHHDTDYRGYSYVKCAKRKANVTAGDVHIYATWISYQAATNMGTSFQRLYYRPVVDPLVNGIYTNLSSPHDVYPARAYVYKKDGTIPDSGGGTILAFGAARQMKYSISY